MKLEQIFFVKEAVTFILRKQDIFVKEVLSFIMKKQDNFVKEVVSFLKKLLVSRKQKHLHLRTSVITSRMPRTKRLNVSLFFVLQRNSI